MNSTHLMIAMFCAIGVAQGFFGAFYLLSAGKKPQVSNRLLAGLLLGLSLRVGKSIYYYLFDNPPHFFIGVGLAGLLVIGPFLWMYIRSVVVPEWRWKPVYYLHFIPALLALFSGLLLKLQQLAWGYHMGALSMLLYIIPAWWTYFRDRTEKGLSRSMDRWMLSILAGTSMVCSGFWYQAVSDTMLDYAWGAVLASLIYYWLFYLALRHPENFTGKRAGNKKNLDKKMAKELAQQLEKIFSEERIYQNADLTLTSLSQQMEVPAYLISKVLNKHLGMSFPEFVNDFRIREVQEKLRCNEHDFIKIEALAYEVGFNSPSAFYTAFKKKTSLTPQEYRNRFVKN